MSKETVTCIFVQGKFCRNKRKLTFQKLFRVSINEGTLNAELCIGCVLALAMIKAVANTPRTSRVTENMIILLRLSILNSNQNGLNESISPYADIKKVMRKYK